MKSLCLISATFPPVTCGIGDYTAVLAGRLADRYRVRLLTARRGDPSTPPPGVEVRQAFDHRRLGAARQLVEAVEAEETDWLFLHYDTHTYSLLYGFDPVLPRVLQRLRRRRPRIRIATMFHEVHDPPLTWKKTLMSTWQRAQILALGRASDVIFFSIDPWLRRMGPWFPGRVVDHLRLGSTIPRLPMDRGEARARLGLGEDEVVLGLFGRAGPSRDLNCIREAVEAVRRTGREAVMMYIGGDTGLVRAALPGTRMIDDNPIPKDEISRRFAAMDVHLLPIAKEGVSTRRTTLMAGLEHGVASVATSGPDTDELLLAEDGRAFLLAPASDPARFGAAAAELAADPDRRRAIAAGGRDLFLREFAWDRIADQVAATLN